MTRMHKLYRHSVTSGKCEDCGLIDSHSNACHGAAPIRKIEALYDENDKLLLQIEEIHHVNALCGEMLKQEIDGLRLQNGELRADVDKFNTAMMQTLAERDAAKLQVRDYEKALKAIAGSFGPPERTAKEVLEMYDDLRHGENCSCSPPCALKPKSECTQCQVVNGIHEAGCCFEKRVCLTCGEPRPCPTHAAGL